MRIFPPNRGEDSSRVASVSGEFFRISRKATKPLIPPPTTTTRLVMAVTAGVPRRGLGEPAFREFQGLFRVTRRGRD